jgi:ABC-type transporter MlaC component
MADRDGETYVTWRQALISGIGLLALMFGIIQFHASNPHADSVSQKEYDRLFSEMRDFRSEMKADVRECRDKLNKLMVHLGKIIDERN